MIGVTQKYVQPVKAAGKIVYFSPPEPPNFCRGKWKM